MEPFKLLQKSVFQGISFNDMELVRLHPFFSDNSSNNASNSNTNIRVVKNTVEDASRVGSQLPQFNSRLLNLFLGYCWKD